MSSLTPEQQARKEANRQRALERLKATKERLVAAKSGGNKIDKGKAKVTGQNRDATKPLDRIEAVNEKFKNYIEYDFAKMKDDKGGFIVDEEAEAPQGMTMEEWQAKQNEARAPLPLDHPDAPKCFECGTAELDFRLYNWFKTRVCKKCRNNNPDKYSLLTKTECKDDYLLTDPELRDEDEMPHIEKPNPHKQTYNNMMLYMRYQVEEFALRKWGSLEALDAEYERRVEAKKKRKDKKFLDKLKEMRMKTRAENITRTKEHSQRHQHEWGEPTKGADNTLNRRCHLCGMTTVELSFG